jgi:Protein of unknown function (DUF732)
MTSGSKTGGKKMKTVAALAAITVGVFVLFWLPPMARADSDDAVFLHALDDSGIHGYNKPSDIINLAHKVCEQLAAGASANLIAQVIASSSNDSSAVIHMSHDQADTFIGAAVGVYCPGLAARAVGTAD